MATGQHSATRLQEPAGEKPKFADVLSEAGPEPCTQTGKLGGWQMTKKNDDRGRIGLLPAPRHCTLVNNVPK
eukprot:16436408-Heterocapsa_arctica.AAC.1